MTALLHRTGEALYGPQWQSALARDLHVSARTVRRWAAGAESPPSIWQAIRELAIERRDGIDALLPSLGVAATP